MSKIFVYSTLTCDQRYTNYAQGGGDVPVVVGSVFIKGGTGVADARLTTPRGVVTEITEEELAILETNEGFKQHRKNGFVEVSTSKVDPEKAAADMEGRDASAPLVPAYLPADVQPKVPDVIPPAPPAPSHGGKRR